MSILPLVLAGHLVGDWVAQTDWQAANKTKSWLASGHMSTYHLTMFLFVAAAHRSFWDHWWGVVMVPPLSERRLGGVDGPEG